MKQIYEANEQTGLKGKSVIIVEWFENVAFAVEVKSGFSSFNQTKKERSRYVKLGVDIPDYSAVVSAAGLHGTGRVGCVDC